jgi:hypothetical protein
LGRDRTSAKAEGETDIRRSLIRKGYIKGIIGLPANLFYGTGIPACIVVVDKEGAHARKGIFLIDARQVRINFEGRKPCGVVNFLPHWVRLRQFRLPPRLLLRLAA